MTHIDEDAPSCCPAAVELAVREVERAELNKYSVFTLAEMFCPRLVSWTARGVAILTAASILLRAGRHLAKNGGHCQATDSGRHGMPGGQTLYQA